MIVRVLVRLDPNSVNQILRITSDAEQLLERFRVSFPDLHAYQSGGVSMMNAFLRSGQEDMGSLMLWAIVVILALLSLMLRSLRATVVSIAISTSAVVITLSVFASIGVVFDAATSTLPLLVFTLVTASSMHILVALRSFYSVVRSDRESCYSEVRRLSTPLLLSVITTVLGLLSMLAVDSPPIRMLGVMAATGLVVGAVLTLTVCPVLAHIWFPKCSSKNVRFDFLLSMLGSRSVRVLGFAATCVALLGLAHLRMDEDFVEYFSTQNRFRIDTEEIERKMFGPYHLEVVAKANKGGLFDGWFVDSVTSLSGYLSAQEEVVNSTSYVDVLDSVREAFGVAKTVDSADVNEQLFLAYELGLKSGQSVSDLVDTETNAARVSVLLRKATMSEIRALEARIYSWSSRELGENVHVTVTGEGIPTAHLSSSGMEQLLQGLIVAILIGCGAVGYILGGTRIAGLAIAATLIPLFAGFGLWGWIAGTIGLSAVLVVAVTIGVLVDDTIHVVERFGRERRRSNDPVAALWAARMGVGSVLLISSIVLIGGFLVIVSSDFRMNRDFGLCAAVIVALATYYNLAYVPWFLGRVAARNEDGRD